jgi:hypothetical protein
MSADSLSPAEICAVAVQQQQRLADDARRIASETSAARLAAERKVAELEAAEAVTLAASAASRDDLKLASAVILERSRLEHARLDLSRAIESDQAATAAAKEADARVDAAERSLQQAQIEEKRASDDVVRAFEKRARSMVNAANTAITDLEAIHALLLADHELVGQLRALGSAETPRDGVAAAGFAIRELLALKASFVNLDNIHRLKWMFDLPGRSDLGSAFASATAAAAAFMEFVFAAILQGHVDARIGAAGRGQAHAERAARIWPMARHLGEAVKATEQDEAAEAELTRQANRVAHQARLAAGVAPAVYRGQTKAPAPSPRKGAPVEDYALEGSADAPGGNAFPTSPTVG